MKKAIMFSLTTVMILLFSQCSGPSSESLLQKDAKRGEIISAILNNHDYSSQLMDSLMHNDHSMMTMNENHDMMRMMMSGKGMLKTMMSDSSMKNMMMNNMMEMMMIDSMACMNMMEMMMGNAGMESMMKGMMDDMRGMMGDPEKKGKPEGHFKHH